jgi:iron-sulfur cluster assembly accessory protein
VVKAVVAITKPAINELKTIIEAENMVNRADYGLRIYVAGISDRGVTYGLELGDLQRDRDVVLNLDGINAFIDQKIEPSLRSIVIDFVENKGSRGFVINQPTCCNCS